MIGTTEFEYCKEKAMGIIADWLWVLAIIIGEITGVIQGELLDCCIIEKHQGKNDNIKLHSSLGEMGDILETEIHEGFQRKTEYLQLYRY